MSSKVSKKALLLIDDSLPKLRRAKTKRAKKRNLTMSRLVLLDFVVWVKAHCSNDLYLVRKLIPGSKYPRLALMKSNFP